MPVCSIRPLDPDSDFEPLAALLAEVKRASLATAAQLRDRHQRAERGGAQAQLLAWDQRGCLVAAARTLRRPSSRPGAFEIDVVVAPPARGGGLGTTLFERGAAFARAHGAVELNASVRDDSPEGLRFAEHRGFRVRRHLLESVLELAAFDPAPHRAVLARARDAGVRFFTLQDEGDTPEARRRLWELSRTIAADNPATRGEPFPSFEDYLEEVSGAPWFRPDGQILASLDDRWVGLAALGDFPERRLANNMVTGVDRACRGRGLAQALKLLAVERAQAYGALTLRTNNDAENAPILAVNRKLGYRPEPGLLLLRRP